ncbi:hypothetical protein [Desulfomarina profundi]|uniref:hypothetical protein n=1 Tax=Desulfomarina profundi TaxID=2772557 RepID=UPI001E4AF05F|nr:hypothetical protein [Desulfomarina profundi]
MISDIAAVFRGKKVNTTNRKIKNEMYLEQLFSLMAAMIEFPLSKEYKKVDSF